MTDKRKKATKVKCKRRSERDESVNIPGYIILQTKNLSFAGAPSDLLFEQLPLRRSYLYCISAVHSFQ